MNLCTRIAAAIVLAACTGNPDADTPFDTDLSEDSSTAASASATLSPDTTADTSPPTTTAPTSTMTASDTESSSSTTASGCMNSSECSDPASPVCTEMACVPCSIDTECEAKDPTTPACSDEGRCVACTAANPSVCGDTTPVCDDENNACVGCSFHEQCSATACNIATGACFTDDCVLTVDGDDGSGADYEDIGDAAMDGCVVIVHELDGASVPYLENVNLDGITVAILAADGEEPIIVGLAGNPSLALTNGATAYVQGLAFRGNQMAVGITATASSLYLDRTEVVGNTGGGITLTGGADGHLRNCFVGGTSLDVPALQVTSSSADVLYSTIISAQQFEEVAALRCSGAVDVTVRNSILAMVGADPEIACVGADVTDSATESNTPGTGNVMVGNVMPAWFVSLNDDFHLTTPPPGVLTAAQWQQGDPPTDIDGEPRPTEPDSPDVAGADVP